MKYALIQGSRVAQVADDPFLAIAPPLRWIPCPDEVEADQFSYDGSNFVPIDNAQAPVVKPLADKLSDVLIAKGIITKDDIK